MNGETFQAAAIGLRAGLTALAILAVFRYALLPTLVEHFREQVFELRRELFMLVATGKVKPNDRAYVRLRRTMNGFLRFAERLTFGRLVLGLRHATPDDGRRYSEEFEASLLVHDKETAETLRRMRNELSMAVVWHVFRCSPLGWIVLAYAAMRALCTSIDHGDKGNAANVVRSRVPVDQIQAEAEIVGHSRQQAIAWAR